MIYTTAIIAAIAVYIFALAFIRGCAFDQE